MTITNVTISENDHIIQKVYVFCSVDSGGEGICGYKSGDNWLSMVTSVERLIPGMKVMAKSIEKSTGKKVIMKVFSLDSAEEI